LYPIPDHPGDDQAFAETIYLTIKLLTMKANIGIYDTFPDLVWNIAGENGRSLGSSDKFFGWV